MTIIGLDDTDSRTAGMCTTYVGHRIADELGDAGHTVDRVVLFRLNPAVEHKTRGNACVAVHTDATPHEAFRTATEIVTETAVFDDEQTNPGVAVTTDSTAPLKAFTVSTVRKLKTKAEARNALPADALTQTYGTGQGIVGATAALGAHRSRTDWTYELIAYRQQPHWGTERSVNAESVFETSKQLHPTIWDTTDSVEGDIVAVPRTPCPVLYGIRGDTPAAVKQAHDDICSEPVATTQLFQTNQGTDMHLQDASIPAVSDDSAYRLSGTVTTDPETRRGGHVFFAVSDGDSTIQCVAFEPTKRFRETVRQLRCGDVLTVCGEVSDGTVKLEKLRVEKLTTTERCVPRCPNCKNTMESAGSESGYRCRSCKTQAEGKIQQSVERQLECGWHEVPPCARRHIAKPLVRGGYQAETHPET